MMSAKVSKERKKSAENKFSKKLNTALITTQNFPYINSIEGSNYMSYRQTFSALIIIVSAAHAALFSKIKSGAHECALF